MKSNIYIRVLLVSMEKIFETNESSLLRLWYVEATIYPSRKYREDPRTRYAGVSPETRRFQIPEFRNESEESRESLKNFFDSCDEEGRFQLRDVVDNTCFSRLHLIGHYPCEPLSIAEAIYGGPFDGIDFTGQDIFMDKERFRKRFRKGEGKIDFIAYAPSRDQPFWYRNLYTGIHSIARKFSFHDFVHVLGKSSSIVEEQIRRYGLPKEVGQR